MPKKTKSQTHTSKISTFTRQTSQLFMDPMIENKNIMTTENKNNWPTATPLASLQETPAVVDCPACNNREMTTCEFVNGGRTQ